MNQGTDKTEFSETIKEAGVHAFGPVMKACEAAGTSFFGGKFEISVACFECSTVSMNHRLWSILYSSRNSIVEYKIND